MTILARADRVDPDAMMGGLGVLLSLDTHGIYGSRIWMLWKDVCGCDLIKFVGALRAVQLGSLAGVNEAALNHAIDNRGDGVDIDAAVAAVRNRLPAFGKTESTEVQP